MGCSSPRAPRSSAGRSRRVTACGRSSWRRAGSPGCSTPYEASGAPAYVADDAVLEAVTGYAVHRGALGQAPAGRCRASRRPGRRPAVVVLEDLTDHTNVGLIFRSAAALGIDAVLLAPRCADPLYRRAVKTSMGAVLTLPYTRLPDWSTRLTSCAQPASLCSRSRRTRRPSRSRSCSPRAGIGSRWCSAARGTVSPRDGSRRPTTGSASSAQRDRLAQCRRGRGDRLLRAGVRD